MHGFNRLGGNSVAETVVAGMIVGEFIADFCDRPENDVDIPTGLVHEFLRARAGEARRAASTAAAPRSADALEARMQEIMTAKVGIFRRGEDLQAAVDELQQLLRAQPQHRPARTRRAAPIRSSSPRTACRRCSSWRCASPTARCTRTESRGAHFRAGLPAPQRRRVAEAHAGHVEGDAATRCRRSHYEPLDVTQMELPPGWRGYGAKDYIDHPDTPQRAAEVEALKQKLAGAPRFAVQEALMPYERPAARALPRPQRAHRRASMNPRDREATPT